VIRRWPTALVLVCTVAGIAEAEPAADKPVTTLKVGEVGRAGGFAVVCSGWQETPDVGRQLPFNLPAVVAPKPEANDLKRLLVDVSVVNVTQAPLGVFPGQLVLLDEAGRIYHPEVEVFNLADPSLFPGERLRQILAFRTPKEAGKLRLLFSTVALRRKGEPEFLPFLKLIDPDKAGPYAPAAVLADIGIAIVDGGIFLLNAAAALDKARGASKTIEAVAFDLSERASASKEPKGRTRTAKPPAPVYIEGEQRPPVAKAARGASFGDISIKAGNVKPAPDASPLIRAAPGMVAIQVDVAIANDSKAVYEMSPWDVSLVTPEGQRFGRAWHLEILNQKLPALPALKPGQPLPQLDLGAVDMDSLLMFRSIQPGGRALVTMTFEVPQNVSALRVRFVPFRTANVSPQLVELPLPVAPNAPARRARQAR